MTLRDELYAIGALDDPHTTTWDGDDYQTPSIIRDNDNRKEDNTSAHPQH